MAGDLEILLRGPTSKNLFQLADLTNDKKTEHLTACHKKKIKLNQVQVLTTNQGTLHGLIKK